MGKGPPWGKDPLSLAGQTLGRGWGLPHLYFPLREGAAVAWGSGRCGCHSLRGVGEGSETKGMEKGLGIYWFPSALLALCQAPFLRHQHAGQQRGLLSAPIGVRIPAPPVPGRVVLGKRLQPLQPRCAPLRSMTIPSLHLPELPGALNETLDLELLAACRTHQHAPHPH